MIIDFTIVEFKVLADCVAFAYIFSGVLKSPEGWKLKNKHSEQIPRPG